MIMKILIFELFNFLSILSKRILSLPKTFGLDVDNKILRRDSTEHMGTLLSGKQCDDFRNLIDRLIDDPNVKVWRDPEGADERIYFAEKVDAAFEDLYKSQIIRDKLISYTGARVPVGMLLAARLSAKNNNLGSGGGWHRDSPFRTQFKTLCYLNKVTSVGGPFQVIKGSHRLAAIIKASVKSLLKVGVYRFSEETINEYLNGTNSVAVDILGDEGDFFAVDTKAIHRGKPIEEGTRYVLFWYFWDGKIPAHIAELDQN